MSSYKVIYITERFLNFDPPLPSVRFVKIMQRGDPLLLNDFTHTKVNLNYFLYEI